MAGIAYSFKKSLKGFVFSIHLFYKGPPKIAAKARYKTTVLFIHHDNPGKE